MAKPPDRLYLSALPAAGLVILLAGTAAAADCTALFDQARKTRETTVSTAAFQSCSGLSTKGDLTGRYLLGLLTIDGIGTSADPDSGLKLVREAADGGLAAAQARLGRMYLRGETVDVDPAVAAGWFQRAASGGDPLAQYELGQLRYKGIGIEADPYEAYKWFTAAWRNFELEGNVPRQKLALRKQKTVAADLSSEDRQRAETWLSGQPGVIHKQ